MNGRLIVLIAGLLAIFGTVLCAAQTQMPGSKAGAADVSAPITLDEAIRRAQANEPVFAAVRAENKALALDRSIARSALLPTVTYHNQALYTQPNGQSNQAGQVGSQPSPRFIANNAVREYASQGIVNETIGLRQFADIRIASAAAARANAELEIARRGLVAAVVGLYYGAQASQRRLAVAQRAADEAVAFTRLTGQRETAREAAHADVVKAQLQQQQRIRELADAQLAKDKAQLELAVLLFPDPMASYTLAESQTIAPLPSRDEVAAAVAKGNPEVASALATVREGDANVSAARAAYLPDLGLNYTYGIDAPQFAKNGPGGVKNLGYSASLTLDIPVWDWLSTEKRVKQSRYRRDAAKVALTATQKRLVVALNEIYAEAAAAHAQLESLNLSASTAAESLRLTKLRYGSGEATVLEVVDAQSALTLAENAKEDGAVRYQSALAQIQTLTGVL